MKSTIRRLALFTLVLSLPLLSGASMLSCADPVAPAADTISLRAADATPATPLTASDPNPQKDETVYVSLALSGEVERIEVVNRLYGMAGTWIEPDPYLTLESLTDGIQPVREPGKMRVECPEGVDVYLQGTLDPATPLPFGVEITWLLDGEPVPADQLAGASGNMGLRLSVTPGPESMREWTARLLLQATVTLDLRTAQDIRADGAARLVAGSSYTLSYSLPGSLLTPDEGVASAATGDPAASLGALWEISFTGVEFQMPAITLTAMPLSSDLLGMGGLTGGLKELQEGAAALAESSTALSGGLDALQTSMGPGAATMGLPELAAGAQALSQGQQALADGLAALGEQVDRMAGGTDTPLRSFAAPDGTPPATLQFLYRTPALEPPHTAESVEPPVSETGGIWQNLLDLFRK